MAEEQNNNVEYIDKYKTGFRIISLLMLAALFYFDKVKPGGIGDIPQEWYGVLTAIAFNVQGELTKIFTNIKR